MPGEEPHGTAGTRARWTRITIALTVVVCLGGIPGALGQANGLSIAPPLTTPTTNYIAIFPSAPNASTVPIQHVVYIMMENHAFDNYFGTYCQKLGPQCATTAAGTPPGTCLPKNPARGATPCIKPFLFSSAIANTVDLDHGWNASHLSYNNGSMNGFYIAEGRHNQTMGYYDSSIIPAYWDVAQQYSVADNFYSSSLTYSLPNHWFLVAGTSPPASLGTKEFNTPPTSPLTSTERHYLNQANSTLALDDLLQNSTTSWRYYDKPLPSTYAKSVSKRTVFSFWDPLSAKSESYTSAFTSHFVTRNNFVNDSKNGTLPNVSWLIPDMAHSDHPPQNITVGMDWAMAQIEAVEASPEWSSTVVFLSWDEYGGFWDHVAPPQVDNAGYGFRVPLLVVSPYTRENYVDHQLGSFDSLLRFAEWRFGFGNFTARDGTTPVPWESFDFTANPRPALTFPALSRISYPVAFQQTAAPPPPTHFTGVAVGTNVTLSWVAPVGGVPVTYYSIQYGPTGHTFANSVRVDGAADGLRITNLTSGSTYTFHLASAGPNASSAWVNVTGITPMVPVHSLAPIGTAISGWLIGTPIRAEVSEKPE
jgi:phospholipase C